MDRRLMVVHAHPDDEVFSTGGVIARYAAAGGRVAVVYCTNGEEGEMYDPDLDPAEAKARLGEIRREEARRACAILGATDVYFLGYRDSGMRDTEPNQRPDAFMNVPLAEATDRLAGIMREFSPNVVITYDEEGGYGHPDHIRTNQVAAAAFEQARHEPKGPTKLYYSARSRTAFRRYAEEMKSLGLAIPWLKEDFDFDSYGLPDEAITAHIDISEYAPLKKQALAVHRTQIKPDVWYLSIPDEVLRSSQGVEYFVRVYPPSGEAVREDDLFAEVLAENAVA